jgi:sulfur carrier protein ThiS
MGITITIKLFASLGQYLPAGSRRNVGTLEVAEEATPMAVVRQLRFSPEQCHLCMINGFHLPVEEWETRRLRDGDALAIWPPVAGG